MIESSSLPARARGRLKNSRTKRPGRTHRERRSHLGAAELFFVIVACLGSVHALGMITLEVNRTLYHHRETQRLEQDIADIQRDISHFEQVIERENDPRLREQLARRNGFVYPDEERLVTTPLRIVQPSNE